MDEQLQPQPDLGDSEMAVSTETPDAYCGQEVRPCSADRRGAQEDANLEQALASVDASSRVRTAGETCKDSYLCFGESRDFRNDARVRRQLGNELNDVALDLHEPDPDTMLSSDLVWVPKSILHEAREKGQ